MSNTYFQFKQFIIHQEHCAMKVSTDGVVLGALAEKEIPREILDIGVGTGVVSLMLAQRFPGSRLTGVEIDEEAWKQACQNALKSPWTDRVEFIHQRFQDFAVQCKAKFDLIVSNPPYYPDHLKSTDTKRNIALHNDGLSFGDLMKGVVKMLAADGLFWIILPPDQMQELERIAGFFLLYPLSKIELLDRPGQKTLRIIQGFSFQKSVVSSNELAIKDSERQYSQKYKDLLKDFLLKF